MDKVLNLSFQDVITWMELSKAEQEIEHISYELSKKKNKI